VRERGSIGSVFEVPGSPSAGSDDAGQGRQIHFLRPLVLALFNNTTEGVSFQISSRVEVPDSRLRVSVALIGEPLAGSSATFIGTKGLALWLRAVEDSINTGAEVPVTNLWGTGAAASPIPGVVNAAGNQVADTSLGGWAKEFVTGGRAMVGTVTTPAGAVLTGAGNLVLQVRYTPEGTARFSRWEWEEIRKACGNRPSYVGATTPIVAG